MCLILCIDTSLEEASICVAENGNVLAVSRNSRQVDHAGWIQTAIKTILQESGRSVTDLSAVAVTSGPGSYTGLRVGMSTAKGMCYALNIPLIVESSLLLLAQRVKKEIATDSVYHYPVLICPMIDARRMEVFAGMYDLDLHEVVPPAAFILDEHSFSGVLSDHVILFCGSGIKKWQNLCMSTNAVFVDIFLNVIDLAELALKKFQKGEFADLAYTEPSYLKSVYTGNPK